MAWHRTEEDAVAALEGAGALWDAGLAITIDVPGVGRLVRHFSVLASPFRRSGTLTPWLWPAIERPLNVATRERMSAGIVNHMPANRSLVVELARRAPALGVHLPWTLRPMNLDLAMKVAERRWPFSVFYSQAVTILPRTLVARGGVRPGPIVPLPVGCNA